MSDFLARAAGSTSIKKRLQTIRPLAEVEREYIEYALAICEGNITLAAKALGISPSTLYRKKSNWVLNDD